MSANYRSVMKTKLTLVALLICAAILFGCSPKPHSIVGSWTLARPGSLGNTILYTFGSDGTYRYAQHAAFESIHSHQTASGTYTYAQGILTLHTTQEIMGIDADTLAAIDAREKKENPHMHIPQDKGDVPINILQPTTGFRVTFESDNTAKLKDLTNFADHGVIYVRAGQAEQGS